MQKMSLRICSLSLPLSFLFLLSQCANVPEKEISEARRAIYQAWEKGVEKYAPNELKQAQDILIEVQSRIENKDYKSAKELAIKAKSPHKLLTHYTSVKNIVDKN